MGKGIVYTAAEAKVINDIARHQMIRRLCADIVMDLQICEIEGWDKREYIAMLKEAINSIRI